MPRASLVRADLIRAARGGAILALRVEIAAALRVGLEVPGAEVEEIEAVDRREDLGRIAVLRSVVADVALPEVRAEVDLVADLAPLLEVDLAEVVGDARAAVAARLGDRGHVLDADLHAAPLVVEDLIRDV